MPNHSNPSDTRPYTPHKCSAYTKRGTPCGQWAVPGRNTCRYHGGLSPRGPAHPRYKHGRYSKYMPTHLARSYKQALEDTELLSLREGIALIESRLVELLGRVELRDSKAQWSALVEVHKKLRLALKLGNSDMLVEGVEALGVVVGAGEKDFPIWDEIFRALESKRKLAESERERLMDMEAVITSEQAFLIIGVLLDSINRNVPDNRVREKIEAEFARLTGGLHMPELESTSRNEESRVEYIQERGVQGV